MGRADHPTPTLFEGPTGGPTKPPLQFALAQLGEREGGEHFEAAQLALLKRSTQVPSAAPFGGGTLCLSPPIIRTSAQNSGGTPPPQLDCTGQYSFHYGHAYLQTYFLTAGQTIRAQYWSRDPGYSGANAVGLTNALAFVLVP